MTDLKPTVVEALSAVMGDVLAVGKDAHNVQAGYAARSIDGVLNAVAPALRKHNVVVTPNVIDAHYQVVPVGRNGTPMRECTLKVRFVFYGPNGDTVEAITMGEALDSGDKATSKAHSMAFKTCLLQALAIPTDEPDPDETSYERAAEPPPPPSMTASQQTSIASKTAALSDDQKKELNTWYKAQRLPKVDKLTEDQADLVIMKLDDLEHTAAVGA